MKPWIVLICALLAGCSGFGHRKPADPPPSEYIVTGAPADALILIDGAARGNPAVVGKPQIMAATAGYHVIEVKTGDTITYREQTYLAPGEHQFLHVLSARH